VQTPGAPLLSNRAHHDQHRGRILAVALDGIRVQQNTNSLASVNWSNIITLPTDNGTFQYILVYPPGGNRFYRLFKP